MFLPIPAKPPPIPPPVVSENPDSALKPAADPSDMAMDVPAGGFEPNTAVTWSEEEKA
jgi:hypothetical protein